MSSEVSVWFGFSCFDVTNIAALRKTSAITRRKSRLCSVKSPSKITVLCIAALGSHYRATDNLLLGAMLQFDYASGTSSVATNSGQGWLAGPYIAAKHSNQPPYLDVSLLYGQTPDHPQLNPVIGHQVLARGL
jgi:hypothetical protein